MKERFVVISLPNEDSYQQCQAKAAKVAVERYGVKLQLLYADNDAVTQSQQVLGIIHSCPKPDAVMVEPMTTTGLERVAESAVEAGIAWVVLNSEVEYLDRMRKLSSLPIFAVSIDQVEIGRVQGRQFAALLPDGGNVLYIQGPATNSAALQRTQGLMDTKPQDLKLKLLRSKWSESDAYQVVSAWLRLSTNRAKYPDLVGCQDGAIAMGARRAFAKVGDAGGEAGWMNLPSTGVDGLPDEGRAWVKDGTLRATVLTAATTQTAIEILMNGFKTGLQPPERTVIDPQSYPPMQQLPFRRGYSHSS